MGRVYGVWATATETNDTIEPAGGAEGAQVVEAVLSWRDTRGGNVLGRKELRAGGTLTLGEQGDLFIPADVLGYERLEVVRFEGGRAVATLAPGMDLRVDGWVRQERDIVVDAGHRVELRVGAFSLSLSLVRAGKRIAPAALDGLRRGGAGVLLGSAIAHALAFAVVAYVSPALGATEDDAYDRDRIELLRKLINASAERETEPPPSDGAASSEGGSESPSQAARGAEGEAGKDTPNHDGRFAVRGTARPDQVTLPREQLLAEAASFGLIPMAAGLSDPNAPTAPWGTVLNGADDVNKVGHLFGNTIDDATGTGGWGLLGNDQGGGGRADMIGLGNGFGPLGTGKCLGTAPCGGIGVGRDRLQGGHVSTFKGPRYGVPQSNGHLPAEVIQRIVRQNDGRYRFCFQQAVQSNPTLSGRVTVKFLISRDGSVGYTADGGSDIPDEGVRQCVVKAFANLSFPPPDSGVVTVFYPIVFSP